MFGRGYTNASIDAFIARVHDAVLLLGCCFRAPQIIRRIIQRNSTSVIDGIITGVFSVCHGPDNSMNIETAVPGDIDVSVAAIIYAACNLSFSASRLPPQVSPDDFK